MIWLKNNLYAAIALAVFAFGLVGLHWWVATTAVKRADAAGYARARAEDDKTLAERQQANEKLLAKDRATTEGLLNDLHIIEAAHRANLADSLSEFSVIRVLAYPRAGDSGAAAGVRRTTGGTDATADDAGGQLPSLAVVGQELSNCELEGDRFAGLQQWVRNRRHIELSDAHQ